MNWATAQRLVNRWRGSNQAIVRCWQNAELDDREAECWRMYAARPAEAYVRLPDASVKGMDSMMGALL